MQKAKEFEKKEAFLYYRILNLKFPNLTISSFSKPPLLSLPNNDDNNNNNVKFPVPFFSIINPTLINNSLFINYKNKQKNDSDDNDIHKISISKYRLSEYYFMPNIDGLIDLSDGDGNQRKSNNYPYDPTNDPNYSQFSEILLFKPENKRC